MSLISYSIELAQRCTAATEQWEAEKVELVKSRDEAVAQAKAAREETEKLREAERGLRTSNEKLGTWIREQLAARQKAIEERNVAIKVAVEKATNELRNTPSANPEDLVKRHAKELRELEERLVAKHKEELNKAVEAATAKAQESQTTPTPETAATAEDQKAAIDAAVATAVSAKDAEFRANRESALNKAVENGRREGMMRLRLKDTQLIKAQNRVRELEKQIEEWRRASSIPSETTWESASAPSPTTSAPPRGAAGATAAPTTCKHFVANVAGGKPAAAAATTSTAGQSARGCDRGTVREHIEFCGAAAPCVGRGTGPLPQRSANGAPASGVAIMGAASKRTREEGEVSTEDSLSKRLKPAPATITPTSSDSSANTSAAGSIGYPGAKPIML